MSRRAAQKELQRLGDILRHVLKRQKAPVFMEDRMLRRVWDQAVGRQISDQTAPLHIKRGVLYVKVATSVWMHQLQFLKDEIIFKFNRLSAISPISALHLSLGEIRRAPPFGKRQDTESLSPLPLKPRDQRIIKESVAAIADPELKDILQRVMTKEITRRRLREKTPARRRQTP